MMTKGGMGNRTRNEEWDVASDPTHSDKLHPGHQIGFDFCVRRGSLKRARGEITAISYLDIFEFGGKKEKKPYFLCVPGRMVITDTEKEGVKIVVSLRN